MFVLYLPGVSLDSSGDLIIAGHTSGTFPGFSSAGGMDVACPRFSQLPCLSRASSDTQIFIQKYSPDGILKWTLQTGVCGFVFVRK